MRTNFCIRKKANDRVFQVGTAGEEDWDGADAKQREGEEGARMHPAPPPAATATSTSPPARLSDA